MSEQIVSFDDKTRQKLETYQGVYDGVDKNKKYLSLFCYVSFGYKHFLLFFTSLPSLSIQTFGTVLPI